jgi:hypothetical protein
MFNQQGGNMNMRRKADRVTRFINTVRALVSPLTDEDLKVDLVLAVLDVRLEGVSRSQSEGRLDSEQAMACANRTLDQAILVLSGLVGVSVRGEVCRAILAASSSPLSFRDFAVAA